jgi:hypothetical protein
VIKLGKPRRGDSSDMAFIEFVDRDGELRKPKSVAEKIIANAVRRLAEQQQQPILGPDQVDQLQPKLEVGVKEPNTSK